MYLLYLLLLSLDPSEEIWCLWCFHSNHCRWCKLPDHKPIWGLLGSLGWLWCCYLTEAHFIQTPTTLTQLTWCIPLRDCTQNTHVLQPTKAAKATRSSIRSYTDKPQAENHDNKNKHSSRVIHRHLTNTAQIANSYRWLRTETKPTGQTGTGDVTATLAACVQNR